jgi:capsular exopolysaccharide synthesis family protein
MGRMQDALKKAAEERERKRISDSVGLQAREAADLKFRKPDADHAPPPAAHPAPAVHPTPAHPVPAHPAPARRPSDRPAPAPRPATAPAPLHADERLIVHHAPSDKRAERFRKIRANLLSLDPRPTTIMLTSGAPNEGKSVTAANLALSLHEMGESDILLVDANLRHPELAGLLGVGSGPGLGEVISTDGMNVESVIAKTRIPGLYLLPAGAGGVAAARQLQPDVLKHVIDCVRSRFGFVIVDTPAISDYADAVLMSNDVDGVLLVVKIGRGRRSATTTAVEALEASKARLLGTVVMTGS